MDQARLDAHVEEAAGALRQADAVLVTAGAGIGVDSGLPDFRGNEGFWRAYPPIARLGLSFSEMANPHWFERDPELAWAFYGHRLNLYRQTRPHDGFTALLDLCRLKPGGYFVFTSNVDGQFQQAGYDPERIVECHGSIHHLQCSRPCSAEIWSAEAVDVHVDEASFLAELPLPACRHCGGLARPNILMFGDWHWSGGRTEGQQQRLNVWFESIRSRRLRLAVVEMGAGEAVPTVRLFSERAAQTGRLIRINPRDWRVPAGHIALPLGAADGIRTIMERYHG